MSVGVQGTISENLQVSNNELLNLKIGTNIGLSTGNIFGNFYDNVEVLHSQLSTDEINFDSNGTFWASTAVPASFAGQDYELLLYFSTLELAIAYASDGGEINLSNGDVVVQDCFGEWNGVAEFDECGECGGDNSSCSGCTDETALNYDPDATIPCADCCEYPNYDGIIVINEINYNPAASFEQGDAEYEFVELYNNSSDNVSLTGWNLTATNIDFTFDEFTLEAGGYVVLARSPETYEGSIGHGGTSLLNNGD
ncbi:uncharacterized protein METZ01_LOCUS456573, partial [marine metagenome]